MWLNWSFNCQCSTTVNVTITDQYFTHTLHNQQYSVQSSWRIPHNTCNTDDKAVNWHSRSFEVIDFCCNRKLIYDSLLVIKCHLSSILHHLQDIASQSRKQPNPGTRGPPSNFIIIHHTWYAKSWGTRLHFIKNRMMLPLTILSQYTRITDDRQTTSYKL